MSQASIPVYTDWILRTNQAQAELKTFESQVTQFTQRLTRQMVEIPLKLDIGDAAMQVDEFTKSIGRDAIKVPIALNTIAADAQWDLFVEKLTSRAIEVPITFTAPGGGALNFPGAGAMAMAGGAGGGMLTAPGPAFLPTGSPAATGPALPTGTAVAAGGALFAAGTTFGYLRGANFYPPAPLTATPMAAPPQMFPPATIFTPANASPVPVPFANTAQGAMAAGAAMTPATGGGGFFSGMMSRRGALGALMALHGINSLVEQIQRESPDRFNAISDPMEQLHSYRAAFEASHSGLRGMFNDTFAFGQYYQDKAVAAIPGIQNHPTIARLLNPYHGVWESSSDEAARLNDAESQARRTDATLARRKQEGAQIRSLTDQVDVMAAEDTGSGTRDKAKALLDKTLTRTLDNADKILEKFINGTPERANAEKLVAQIKAHAVSIRDRALKQLDDDESARLDAMGDEKGAIDARLRGDLSGERRLRLQSQIAQRQRELDKEGGADADYFRHVLAPAMLKGFDRDEATTRAGERLGSDARVAAYRQQGAVAGIRLRGGNEIELAEAQNRAIDEHVRQLERAAAIETDLVKKAEREREAAAAKEAAETEKQLNLKEAALRREMSLEAERHTAEMAHLEAEGRSWDATLAEIEARRKRAVEEARGDKEKVDAANATAAAQAEAARRRHDDQVRSLTVSARQGELRATGRRGMADVLGIAEHTRADLARNADDPEMQAAILRGGRAELMGFLHPDNHAGVYSSAADYATALQTQSLDNDAGARKEAERLIKLFGEAVDKFGSTVDKPVSGFGGFGLGRIRS